MQALAARGDQNIIRLQKVVKAENDKDIYLVFDFMDTGARHLLSAINGAECACVGKEVGNSSAAGIA